MNNYVIFTDSACDVHPAILSEWGVKMAPLTFRFSDSDKEYLDGEMPPDAFYKRMRSGEDVKTSAVNSEYFKEKFTRELDAGNDILYLGFSSVLSATYSCAALAAEELSGEAPERRIVLIDTKSASAGLGLLVYLTVKEKERGADIDKAAELARGLSQKICHWFTVDDLTYLKRGGRINPTTAFFGNMLGIKPILLANNDGALKKHSKTIGRRAAIEELAKKYGELAEDKTCGTVFISHADAEDDAKLLQKMLAEKYGVRIKLICNVGCVIGAHAGPGTLALFFVGKYRNSEGDLGHGDKH